MAVFKSQISASRKALGRQWQWKAWDQLWRQLHIEPNHRGEMIWDIIMYIRTLYNLVCTTLRCIYIDFVYAVYMQCVIGMICHDFGSIYQPSTLRWGASKRSKGLWQLSQPRLGHVTLGEVAGIDESCGDKPRLWCIYFDVYWSIDPVWYVSVQSSSKLHFDIFWSP